MNEPTLEAVRAALGSETNASGRRVFSSEARAEARNYTKWRVAAGARLGEVSAELGLNLWTLQRWLQQARTTTGSGSGFSEIQVTAPTMRANGPVVHGPCGTRVDGLDVAGVADLLQRLSCLG
jgi:hypothetical protein